MKSILISIRPKWCELIASGKKTIEVRRTRPKIETPFKCYIYCTQSGKYKKGKSVKNIWMNRGTDRRFIGNGKVIGEFVCRHIEPLKPSLESYGIYDIDDDYLRRTCLTHDVLWKYGNGATLYAWIISDLKIYDKPRELSEFCMPCKTSCEDCKNPLFYDCWLEKGKIKKVTRPPQSWMYVEELS